MATPKQEKLAVKMLENVRAKKPQSIGKLMRDVGYSKGIASQPSRIVKTSNFIDLLERSGVTDKRITTVVKDALYALNGRKKDHGTRLRAAEMACRLKGHLKDKDNSGADSIANLIQGLKAFNIDALIVLKQRLSTEPVNAPSGNQ